MTTNGGVFLIALRGFYEWFEGKWTHLFPGYLKTIRMEGEFAVWQWEGKFDYRKAGGPNRSIYWPDGGKIIKILPNGFFRYAEENRVLEFQGDTAVKTVFTAQHTDLRVAATDGFHFLYLKSVPGENPVLAFHDGTTERILPLDPATTDNFRVNNGWIAYTAKGGLGQDNVRLRSPDGQDFPVTFFGASSKLGALAPNGELTFVYGNERYWMDSQGKLRKVSGPEGREIWQDNGWNFILGASLLRFKIPDPIPTTVMRSVSIGPDQHLNIRDLGAGRRGDRTFRVTGVPDLATEILLLDPSGRKCYEYSLRLDKGGSGFLIPLGNIPKGVSFLRVRSGRQSAVKVLLGG
jgi:hypothetical protein